MLLPEFRRALTQALVQREELADLPSDLEHRRGDPALTSACATCCWRPCSASPCTSCAWAATSLPRWSSASAAWPTRSASRSFARSSARRCGAKSRPRARSVRSPSTSAGFPRPKRRWRAATMSGPSSCSIPGRGRSPCCCARRRGRTWHPMPRRRWPRRWGCWAPPTRKREEYPSAEEVLRLGVQWVQDGNVAGQLFAQLGEVAARQSQHGQAIGLLRRALSLGCPRGQVLPALAECFLARGRAVAALVCSRRGAAARRAPGARGGGAARSPAEGGRAVRSLPQALSAGARPGLSVARW